ncbi:MAG: hypothetical protein ACYC1E_02210 [Propionibacteriaceae bacterium]
MLTGLSTEEVAKIVHRSPGAVRVAAHRGLPPRRNSSGCNPAGSRCSVAAPGSRREAARHMCALSPRWASGSKPEHGITDTVSTRSSGRFPELSRTNPTCRQTPNN